MDDHAAPALDLAILGTPFRVRTRWEATRAALARQWSRCLTDPTPGAIEVDAGDTAELSDRDGYQLASRLTLRAIEGAIGSRLMFHAAGLATDRGEVVALIAPSGTGKTTAARTLCRVAFGYVTDETVSVGVQEDLDVLPYPKPLSIVPDGSAHGGKTQHSPDELGLRPAPADLRLVRLVLLDRRDEPGGPSLAPVGLLDGLLEASQQISALSRLTDPLQVLCRTAEACHGFYRLSYRDVATTAPLIDQLLAEPPAGETEAWEPWQPQGRPSQWTDAVLVGPEALVLLGTVPIRLGPLGRTSLEVLLGGGDEAEALAEMTRLHGAHPDAPGLVAAAIAALHDSGLLPAPD